MAKPTKKARAIENIIDLIAGVEPNTAMRPNAIYNDKCIGAPLGCGGDATKFKNEISKREYRISGFCQQCQDNMFGA